MIISSLIAISLLVGNIPNSQPIINVQVIDEPDRQRARARPIRPGPVVAKVTRIIDGDTFEVETGNPLQPLISVRIRGINAPEHRSQCGKSDREIQQIPDAKERRNAREQRERMRQRERELAALADADLATLLSESQYSVILTNIADDAYGGRVNADVTLSNGQNLRTAMLERKNVDSYDGRERSLAWCDR